MKTLNASLIVEKNKLYSKLPWIILFEVGLDSDSTAYFAAYPEDVTFPEATDGDVYTSVPAVIDDISETSQGRIDTVRVSIANVNRVISAYVENNQILGQDVTIRIVHADHLATAAAKLDFTYRVNKIDISDEVASFELGHEDLLALQIPRQRYIRGKCRHVYKDARCNYPSDDFGLSTKQDLRDARTTGDPFEKLNGWYVLNPTACNKCDVSVTTEGVLTIGTETGAISRWYQDETDNTFVYKRIQGDFTAEVHFNHSALTNNSNGVHFMACSETESTHGPTNWVSYIWYRGSGTDYLNSVSNTSSSYGSASETYAQYAKIQRAGNTLTLSSSSDGVTWTEDRSLTRTDFSSTVRIGFAAYIDNAGATATDFEFSYLKITGGLSSCDYTLDGSNGCRVHKNTTRFGGFPGIPYGRLYGI